MRRGRRAQILTWCVLGHILAPGIGVCIYSCVEYGIVLPVVLHVWRYWTWSLEVVVPFSVWGIAICMKDTTETEMIGKNVGLMCLNSVLSTLLIVVRNA